MEEGKFDLEHSNEVLERMNSKIKEFEEKILQNKTPEEQTELKKQWEENKLETEQKSKKELEKFEKERAELEKKLKELLPLEDIKEGLNGIIKELDDKWNETLKNAIEELSKGKTEAEKAEIMKNFKNSFMK